MKRIASLVILAVVVSSAPAVACSWAEGYFQQVTSLRGKVVGKNLKALGPVQYSRWLRQSFTVSEAELILVEYRSIQDVRAGRPEHEVARTRTDASGNFDFGQVPPGHYTLRIAARDLQDRFDVEITQTVPQTNSVLIDISPNLPDCKGGHEFIVRTKS